MITIISLQKNGAAPKDTIEISNILLKNKIRHTIIINEKAYWPSTKKNDLRTIKLVKTYKSNKYSFIWFSISLFRPIKLINDIVKSNNKIIYFTHFHPWLIFILFINSFTKRWKIIYGIHENPFLPKENYSNFINILEKYFLKKVDYIFAHSEFLANQLKEKINNKKIFITPLGTYLSTKVHNLIIKNFTTEEINILFLGRIEPYKGLDLLLKVYSKIFNKKLEINLTIAGNGNISDNQKNIISINKITLINHWLSEDEIENILQKNHILIVPYINATQSGVISLGMVFGLPSIVSNIGGLPEQIINNKTGLLFQPNNEEELFQKIEYLYKNRDVLKLMSENCILEASSALNWQKTADAINEIFLLEN